nr:E69 [uncultured bacterium]
MDNVTVRSRQQQPGNKTSQLIEVIGVRQVYVSTDCDFITFRNVVGAKDYNRNLITNGRFVSNPTHLDENVVR